MKWTEFKTPTGQTGNILSPASWVSGIVGVLFLLITLGLGQHLFQKATNRLPQARLESFVTTPSPIGSSAPSREVYS